MRVRDIAENQMAHLIDTRAIAESLALTLQENEIKVTVPNMHKLWEKVCDVLGEDMDEAVDYLDNLEVEA